MVYETIWLQRERNVSLERYQLSHTELVANVELRPTVLVLPGGGYQNHAEREAEPVAMAFLAKGYNAFVLRYSVAEYAVWPNPLNDVEQALRLIRQNAAAWQVDPEKICTVGFSAGGHLSIAVSSMGAERPNAQIVGYPVVNAETVKVMPVQNFPELLSSIDQHTVPTFVFATMEDELVPVQNSIQLIAALDRAGVESEIHIFKRGCHGACLATPHDSSGLSRFVHPEIAVWFEMAMTFLRDLFGDFPQTRTELI